MGFFSDMKLFFDYVDVEHRGSRENKLYQAITNNDLEQVKRLLRSNLLIGSNEINWTEVVLRLDELALYYPCKNGNVQMVEELLKAGMPVKTRDSKSYSALEYAIAYNQKEIVKLLIKYGAKVNTRYGTKGRTPLFLAVTESQDIEMVKILVDSGAKIDVKEENGFPAVAFTLPYNLKDILKLFIDLGVDVNMKIGPSDITLLENAILDRSNLEIIELLLLSGADPYLKNSENRCAFDIAIESNNQELINLLSVNTQS